MSVGVRIAHNTIVQVIGKAFAVVFGVIGVGMLTRYLGQEGFGEYTTVVAFVQLFGTVADLGLYIITIKKISEADVDANRMFANIFALRIVSALVFVVLGPLAVLFFPYPAEIKIGVAILSAINLFTNVNQMLVGLYQKSLAMVRSVIGEIIGKAFLVGAFAWLISTEQSLPMIFAAVVVSGLLQTAVGLVLARPFIKIGLRFDMDVWKAVLKESWPIAISIALNLIYFRADTIILSMFRGAADVGLYGAGYKVLEVLVAIPAMISGLVMPFMTKAWTSGNKDEFHRILQQTVDMLALGAIPMVAGVFALAHPVMTLVAGSEFEFSGSLLRVLVFAAGSTYFGSLFGNAVVAIGSQRRAMRLYLFVAVVGLVGYFSFIPLFGYWGAATITVLTELIITFGSFFIVWRVMRRGLSLKQTGYSIIGSAGMLAAIMLLRPYLNPFVLIPIGAIVYAGIMMAFGALQVARIRSLLRIP